ncbi:transcription factor A, mitochondrial-like [Bradysia coprophila]|uniref:transcription factor A, mitochondrial-like n=1 Tax=Bradysia coprophila TaxID=38358 RepID=UPI00187DCD12|nr:transcription factor A, mitochondrial-like [Bradysia coprophila]
MISNLSNSFRVLSMQHVALKSSLNTVHKIQLRDIHLHQPMLKSLEEKLGLPAKPKKPASAYFRYMNEIRSSVQAKNPKLKSQELVSLIAKMWRSLDANRKEKFAKGFHEESNAYTERMAKYKDSLSEEDARKIKEMRFEKKERKVFLLYKKKCQELGKPKKPASNYIRFFQMQTDRQPKEQHREFVKRTSAKWNALSDTEKAKYSLSSEEEQNYKKALVQWENKMRKLGHFDIVSSEPTLTTEKPKPRSRKPSVE